MAGPFYMMPSGKFPVDENGAPVLITEAEFEECCCQPGFCKVTVNFRCSVYVTASGGGIYHTLNSQSNCDDGIGTPHHHKTINVPSTGWWNLRWHPTVNHAWSRWASGNCTNCWTSSMLLRHRSYASQGYKFGRIFSPVGYYALIDGWGTPTNPPLLPENYWTTPAAAAAAARSHPVSILCSATNLEFWIDDDLCSDNRGAPYWSISKDTFATYTKWEPRDPDEDCQATYGSFNPGNPPSACTGGTWELIGRVIEEVDEDGTDGWS